MSGRNIEAKPMNMSIQGDGIALPPGLDLSSLQPSGDAGAAPPADKSVGDRAPSPKGADPATGAPNRGARDPGRPSPPGALVRPTHSGPKNETERDPVARRIDLGLERAPQIVRPVNVNIDDAGVKLPKGCTGDDPVCAGSR